MRGGSGVQAAGARDAQFDPRPVQILTAMGKRLEQAVAQQISKRHRQMYACRGLLYQPYVLQSQRQPEAGGTIAPRTCRPIAWNRAISLPKPI